MLAGRRGFYRDGKEVIKTPLLLPSFSSKRVPQIKEVIQGTSERIGVPCLISAYDLYHQIIEGPFSFAEALFIDSGGFEASKELEFSDFGLVPHEPLEWDEAKYSYVVNGWKSATETVIVSYDHPKERFSTTDQIARADEMIPKRAGIFREILFKPEPVSTDSAPDPLAVTTVNVDAVIANIGEMCRFDAIGFTEKEIGTSLKERIVNIARTRRALIDVGMKSKPIHVFGSLDTICTPLYYIAGADIFDGLTWLKFSYYQGMTIYRQNYAACALGMDFIGGRDLLDLRCHWDNIAYLKDFELRMRRYPTKGSKCLPNNRELQELIAETEKMLGQELGA